MAEGTRRDRGIRYNKNALLNLFRFRSGSNVADTKEPDLPFAGLKTVPKCRRFLTVLIVPYAPVSPLVLDTISKIYSSFLLHRL